MRATDAPPAADEAESLQAVLARKGARLRFDAGLEQAYERDTGAKRGKRIFFCNVLATVIFALLATVDIQMLNHAAATLEVLRNAVLVLSGAVLLWQWRRLPHLPPRDREWLTALGSAAMIAYIACEAHAARDVLGVMVGGHMLFAFLLICLVTRLRFPVAVALSVMSLVAYALAASSHDPLMRTIVRDFFVLFVGAAAISLASNYLLERKERRAYLMQRLSSLRRDVVRDKAEAVRRLTLRDPLTGLANRRHFDDEIAQLWRGEQGRQTPVGLLQIDIDFFKRYNDAHGHPLGDVCLQRVGASLSETASACSGLAARIGGEEFAVLLPGQDLAGASAVAARLCGAVRALAIPHGDSVTAPFVSVSVGVASLRPAAGTPAALTLAADLALYRAKHAGRDRFAPAEPGDFLPAAGTAAPALEPASPPARSEPGPAAASARVEAWQGLLVAGLQTLRFPREVEAAYQAAAGWKRQHRLAGLVFACLIAACGYAGFGLPAHFETASEFLRGTFVLCGVLAMPWLATVWRPMPWRWRETLFSGTAAALLVGLLLLSAQSSSPGVQSNVLCLGLILIVVTVIAAPPLRFALWPSAVLCLAVAGLTWSSDEADQVRWLTALFMLLGVSIYSLVGCYVADLSGRRDHLLRRLGEAQINELQDINANLQALALTDPLTRLPNRRHFESQLSDCWDDCRSTDAPLALLILDIDHFKAYNDGYGHLAGDTALQNVGAFIAEWCAARPPRPGATSPFAARLGGEEFGVLLPGHDTPSALATATQIGAALSARRTPHAHSLVADVLTASIGVASLRPSDSPELRQLLTAADQALYRAKAGGRNRASA